jgi:Zn-dependent peptidase ImmA (M78 family)/transcriptional regulator with XRE-family HTH domain
MRPGGGRVPFGGMTATTTWVAGQLRAAREQRGWSQQQLAERLNRTQTSISYWESGKRKPDIDDLLDLSSVLELDVNFFLPPERHRQPIRAILRATAERVAGGDLQQALERLVDEADAAAWPIEEIEIRGRTPAQAAEELIDKAGVAGPPVPVDRLAALCGVLVLKRPFPDELSGLVFEHENGAVIGVNTRHHENRQRFTTAHELGHYLLGHHDRFHIDVHEGELLGHDYRAERAANEFAAELLMPQRFVHAEFAQLWEPATLATRFEVSELAMGYRLVNLGLR